jgi:hypothetical protein
MQWDYLHDLSNLNFKFLLKRKLHLPKNANTAVLQHSTDLICSLPQQPLVFAMGSLPHATVVNGVFCGLYLIPSLAVTGV